MRNLIGPMLGALMVYSFLRPWSFIGAEKSPSKIEYTLLCVVLYALSGGTLWLMHFI